MKKETFRQLFIKISKHITKRQYDCYSSVFNSGFYDIFSREIENNLPVKDKLYSLCENVMRGKYRFKYVEHLTIDHFNSDKFYFESRLRILFNSTLVSYGISKKNSYFICTNLMFYFKNIFLR